jgi:hypothetical protein
MDKSMTPGSTPGHRFMFADPPAIQHPPIQYDTILDSDIVHDSAASMESFLICKENAVNIQNNQGDIVFQGPDREVLRIAKDGRFIVDGHVTTTDAIDVFEHFVEWLDSVRS